MNRLLVLLLSLVLALPVLIHGLRHLLLYQC